MTPRAVHFDEVEIHRVLDIQRGEGFRLSELSSGVNLIHGPNGSGKSATARTIQELLWPAHTELQRPTVAGRFRDGEASWSIDIDAGHVEAACNGHTGTLPELGPAERRNCYHLALHELIRDDNANFAKSIADASQGGYDLDSAANALGFTDRPSSPRGLVNKLKESRDAVDAARRHQRDIEVAAAELTDLRQQRNDAIEAERNIGLLQKAHDYCEAQAQHREVTLKLRALPDGVAKLRGDEREKLDQLAERHDQLSRELSAENAKLKRAEQELEKVNLPEEGINQTTLASLRAKQRRLAEVESELRQKHQQCTDAGTEAEKARQNLGERLTEDQLASLETVEISGLNAFARRADKVRAKKQVLKERRSSLDGQEPQEVQALDQQQIRDGITALGHWLASPHPASKVAPLPRGPILIATALIAALAFTLALLHHWAWSLIALAGAAVAVWDFWLHRLPVDSAGAETRNVHQQSYATTGLQPPPHWNVSGVSEWIRHLVHLANKRASEDERLRRLDDVQTEAESLNQQIDELDTQRRRLQNHLGLNIDVADEWLPLLIDNIGSWQRANARAASNQQVLEELQEEQKRLLVDINVVVKSFNYNEVELAEAAAQVIENLNDRQARHFAALNQRTDAQQRIDEALQPSLHDVANQRKDIFERLGLSESDDVIVNDWLAERPNYVELNTQLTEAEVICSDRRQALHHHQHLLELDLVAIQQQIQQEQAIAGKRDALSEQIAGIERDIETAKAGHELSEALEANDVAVAALADVRHDHGCSVTGSLLTNWVRTIAVERSRPMVFRRANELLIRFTGGTLKLEIDDHASPPAFLARRGARPARPVDELSVGERVQLLMAIRLAFLEQDESTQLPLLLDETLGTSDDSRAGLIIDTVIEIARSGRQVFYFTAQQDEVGKWIARLNESGTPHKVIDLAELRHLTAASAAPLHIAAVDAFQAPCPDGATHEEYAGVLGVPNIDPTDESLDALHLWHIIDDVDLLHKLLNRRITCWGQLRTLLHHDGAGIVDAVDGQFIRAKSTVKAVDAACVAWRIGRGKSVDRHVLQDSGCVSDTFLNSLADLAKSLDGDAQAMINALERGDVSRWRSANTDALRDYFVEQGYLTTDEQLSVGEIRTRALASVADEIRREEIQQAVIDRMIAQLPALPHGETSASSLQRTQIK
jgi:DNA repair exonuclease SbcCD ATPase subunit